MYDTGVFVAIPARGSPRPSVEQPAMSKHARQVVIERDVAEGVHRIEDAFTNWYLIEDGGRLTIVDAGVPASWASLHRALGELGRTPSDIEAVVLTHAHYDHVGFAERARQQLGVPVYVHENDAPLARHPLQYTWERSPLRYVATHPRALPIVAALARARAFFPSAVRQVTRFSNGTLPVPGSPRVVPTPGHTLGHVSLHLPDRDAVIAGDAIVMLDPYMAEPGPRPVCRAATADPERALASLDALAATGAGTVLTGHGPVWTDGAENAAEMARRIGIP
jgi:glyoxylase-like metal-dependent hydrolase (beta-lactamase superfamily II)